MLSQENYTVMDVDKSSKIHIWQIILVSHMSIDVENDCNFKTIQIEIWSKSLCLEVIE